MSDHKTNLWYFSISYNIKFHINVQLIGFTETQCYSEFRYLFFSKLKKIYWIDFEKIFFLTDANSYHVLYSFIEINVINEILVKIYEERILQQSLCDIIRDRIGMEFK